MTTLFIYGTLKRGHSAHHLLANQQFLGEAVTTPQYRIVDLGPHPTLVEATDGVPCHGELWRVDDEYLRKLEAYEDAPTYYHRRSVMIQNCTELVEAFFRVEPASDQLPWSDRWPAS
jgi:gamma-glutamylcyclotransferase (GGCT)/AIG2-like uncharacterized protein YtfP